MKKSVLFLAVAAMLLTACGGQATQPGDANAAAKATRQAAKETQAALAPESSSNSKLVRVSVMCTLQGQPADTTVAAGAEVVLFWDWIAATQEQAQAGIDQSQIVVTLDGQPLAKIHTRKATQTADGKFNVTWWSNVGVLAAGAHTVTYSASWKGQVTDGTSTFGPGGMFETQADTCTITVQ